MSELENIWPRNFKIEVLGVTGDYGSGKTLFVCTIDPGHTLYFDHEKSGGCYEQLGIKRVDVPNVLYEKFKGKEYSPRQAFEWWLGEIRKIKPGEYSVIAVDPISDIEDGLVDWVASRFKTYGFSSEKDFRSMGGVFWGKVKSEWKRILLGDIATKCQTFAFTTHLRQVFRNGKAVYGEYEAKGKNTLRETASLFLTLDRKPVKKGEDPPVVPSAEVDKNRLSVIVTKDGVTTVTPALPPRLAQATPQVIRDYIVNPPDAEHLKDEEKLVEKELSEAERLRLQQEIAESNREAAEAQERASKYQADVATARQKALASLRPGSNGGTQDVQEELLVKEDLRDEEEVRNFLNSAYQAQLLDRVLKGVWKTLNDRGIDVSGFNKDTAVQYTRQLKEEEFNRFQTFLEKESAVS